MKKNLFMSVIVAIVAVGLVPGCAGKKIGNLSEKDFIELSAQLMVVGTTENDPEEMGAKIDGLLKKYNITQEDLSKLSSGPGGDELRKRIGPKIMKRAKELGAE